MRNARYETLNPQEKKLPMCIQQGDLTGEDWWVVRVLHYAVVHRHNKYHDIIAKDFTRSGWYIRRLFNKFKGDCYEQRAYDGASQFGKYLKSLERLITK